MKKYRLLKDLPKSKAGDVFVWSGSMQAYTNEKTIWMHQYEVFSSLDDKPEWFELIPDIPQQTTKEGFDWEGAAKKLWSILDDIDTSSDIRKPTIENPKSLLGFYAQTMAYVAKRFKILSSDGYNIFPKSSKQSQSNLLTEIKNKHAAIDRDEDFLKPNTPKEEQPTKGRIEDEPCLSVNDVYSFLNTYYGLKYNIPNHDILISLAQQKLSTIKK